MPHRHVPSLSERLRRRAFAYGLELWVALVLIYSGVEFFRNLDKLEEAAISVIHPWDYGWNAGLIVAGSLMIVGVVIGNARVEIAGLGLCTMSLVVYAVAICGVRGWSITVGILLGLAAACVGRVVELLRLDSVAEMAALNARAEALERRAGQSDRESEWREGEGESR